MFNAPAGTPLPPPEPGILPRRHVILEQLRSKKGFICDMDGVIYHGNRLLPGVKEFVDWLYR